MCAIALPEFIILADTWFIRRGETRKGPFPAASVVKFLALGRLRDGDDLSRDGNDWLPLSEARQQFAADLGAAELESMRQREDERRGFDRRDTDAGSAVDSRRKAGRDRRSPESETEITRRQRHTRFVQRVKEQPAGRNTGMLVSVATSVVVIFAVSFLFSSMPPDAESNCAASAAPGVDWQNCRFDGLIAPNSNLTGARLINTHMRAANLAGARLEFADLAYAELNGADLRQAKMSRSRLAGANLSAANLSNADLRQANLAYANLSRARLNGALLEGARLDKAVWIDERVCGANSIGRCR